MSITISKTELARNTHEIVAQARRGRTIIVQSYGEDQVVLLDALDYRILKAVVHYALGVELEVSDATDEPSLDRTVEDYLEERISLAKAAEALQLSRFELMERFERLGVPLRQGSETREEVQEEIAAARRGRASSA